MGDARTATRRASPAARSPSWRTHEYRELRDGDPADAAAAQQLEDLREYNEYDCLSTLRLRDWLLSLPGGERPAPMDPTTPVEAPRPPGQRPGRRPRAGRALRARVDRIARDRTPEQQACAMLAAALDYHRRESLPFWWEHFRRLAAPVEDWEHDGEVFVVDPAEVGVEDWAVPKRTCRRTPGMRLPR